MTTQPRQGVVIAVQVNIRPVTIYCRNTLLPQLGTRFKGMRGRDIENQAEGEATRFLSATPLPGPASQQVLKEGSDDQAVLPGSSTAGERKRAGRLRKLITRGPTRFDEVSAYKSVEVQALLC
ncbi:hypothetical protein E2C01_027372 [Portunus trituberculatus]|uniref:Uncharacterized protein n=1 Tax=Portunus trituberculatus TaxID=210409 RepID=A0A5B7EHY9_PORTR|nr:hypothetical protein [Portunus trituberculatus]